MLSDRPVDGFEKAELGSSAAAPWGHNDVEHGLTKRELFAAMAMQGLCANPEGYSLKPDHIAELSVSQADALIAELCK